MSRLRLFDCRLSRLPSLLGICQGDIASVADRVNTAQRRLLFCKEAGDEGWYGTFAEVRFNGLCRRAPYITLPREVARIEAVNVCNRVVPVNNQYLEYLQFGNGRMPKRHGGDDYWIRNVYQRNNAVTFIDLPYPGMYLRVYSTDPADVESGVRLFLQGTDGTDTIIYSQDGLNQVQGVFVPFDSPFAQSPMVFNAITGIQKDVTVGQIQIFAVDAVTDAQTLLLTMEPSETVAGYRRYYFHNLPRNCCQGIEPNRCQPGAAPTEPPLHVTAIVKLDLIPVVVDTDYTLINELEAIIEECVSVRLSESDNPTAKQEAALHHQNAVRMLNGQLVHFLGKNNPAVNFAPFGSARLERLRISML